MDNFVVAFIAFNALFHTSFPQCLRTVERGLMKTSSESYLPFLPSSGGNATTATSSSSATYPRQEQVVPCEPKDEAYTEKNKQNRNKNFLDKLMETYIVSSIVYDGRTGSRINEQDRLLNGSERQSSSHATNQPASLAPLRPGVAASMTTNQLFSKGIKLANRTVVLRPSKELEKRLPTGHNDARPRDVTVVLSKPWEPKNDFHESPSSDSLTSEPMAGPGQTKRTASPADVTISGHPNKACRHRLEAKLVMLPGCVPKSVLTTQCIGTCHSRSVPDWNREAQQLTTITHCTCCSHNSMRYVNIRFRCPRRRRGFVVKRIGYPFRCSCRPCGVTPDV